MRLLLIIGVLAFILLLIYLRLRPYIIMARRMFSMAQGVNRAVRNGAASSTRERGADDHLLRCGSCGTWIPSSRAIKLRTSNIAYCSHACLENAAEGTKRKAAG
ncbi:MAG TPA: hypothetical protein VKB86_11660 [Pyrinomonadaceae bacterium]|nr:hypothetical protein [Pyrinomonadaceae bacterium]